MLRHKHFSLKSLAAACIFCAVVLTGNTQASTSINLSYNGAPDPDKNAVHAFAIHLKTLVEEKTQGQLELVLYPNSMLGTEEERMEQTMSSPSLNIASFAGVSPLVDEIFISATPFLFDNFDSARAFFDEGQYWQEISTSLKERAGVDMLSVVEEGGFLAFTNNKRPINSPTDFKGLRFRAMDPSQVALYEAFGASGTPIPWTEVYMSLRTGVADGQMNPPMYIILGSLYEVQQYLTLANIKYSMQFLVGNSALMESLDETTRTAFLEAIAEATTAARDNNEAQVESRIAYLVEKGMEVIRPTREDLDAFRNIGQPAFLSWLKERGIDQQLIDMALEDAKALAR